MGDHANLPLHLLAAFTPVRVSCNIFYLSFTNLLPKIVSHFISITVILFLFFLIDNIIQVFKNFHNTNQE